MKKLDRLTDQPKQRYSVPLDDGGTFTIELIYLARPQLWMMNIAQGDFKLNGVVMTTYPNLLRQYKNLIQFGLMVVTADGTDPMYLDDFVTGRVGLYQLEQDDVDYIEREIFA